MTRFVRVFDPLWDNTIPPYIYKGSRPIERRTITPINLYLYLFLSYLLLCPTFSTLTYCMFIDPLIRRLEVATIGDSPMGPSRVRTLMIPLLFCLKLVVHRHVIAIGILCWFARKPSYSLLRKHKL